MSHPSTTSRLRRRFTKVLLSAAVTAAAVVVPAAAASAATPCESNCVSNINTAIGGRGATVFVWTTAPTRANVTFYRSGVVGKAAYVEDNTFRTAHILNSPNTLLPGTDYTYSLLVYDKAGHQQWRLGSFTTLSRQLKVTINTIQVDDDGDTYGPGEETFYARAGSASTPAFISDKSVSSGTALHPKLTITQTNPPLTSPINVEMVDADCGFCTYGLGGDWTTGSSSQKDWVTAWKWVDTSVPTNGPQDFVEWNSGPAGITVWGTYEVKYV